MIAETETQAPTTDDLLVDLTILTHELGTAARTALKAAETDRAQRISCSELIEAAIRLRTAIWSYARRITELQGRRIEGLALGYEDAHGRLWFLHHSLHWGSLLTTDRPETAALWPDMDSLREWARQASVPKGEHKGKPWPPPIQRFDERDLNAYRVRVIAEAGPLIRRKIQSL